MIHNNPHPQSCSTKLFLRSFGLLTILDPVCKLTPAKVKGRFTLVIQKEIL